MKTPAESAPPDEPARVRLHTSLTERPLFGGVDFEFWMIAGGLCWFGFLMFKLTIPFWLILGLCVALFQALWRANKRDAFFVPIIFRALAYRRRYAARMGPTEVGPVRPSIPPRSLPM